MGQIPRILHQIFFSPNNEIPADYLHYRETWRQHHPDWELRIWHESECRQFMEAHYPGYLSLYDGYPHRIQRIDAIRYFILDRLGGVYADMDIECLKPIDPLLEGYEVVLGRSIGGVTNAIMGSVPGHPLWAEVHASLPRHAQPAPPSRLPWRQEPMGVYVGRSTGPIMLSQCVTRLGWETHPEIKGYPSYVFEPLAPREKDGQVYFSNDVSQSYTHHHMSTHWLSPGARRLSQLTGALAGIYWRVANLLKRHP